MEQEALALIAGLVVLMLLVCGGCAVFMMRGTPEEQVKGAAVPQVALMISQCISPERIDYDRHYFPLFEETGYA